jgi:DNA-binding NtrC family response regulator
MPPTLLWLTAHAQLPAETEWQDLMQEFEVIQVATLSQAAQALGSERIHCTLVAGPIPGSSPIETLEVVHAADPQAPVVILDPEMTAAQAVQFIRNGAYHCFGGSDSLEALRQCLHQACDENRRREKQRNRIPAAADLEQWIVGESRAIEDVLNTIRLIGPRRCTVLITGETGTGKELLASAIHHLSARAARPLVAFSCANLPETLIEAELFGHEKGAFTGAAAARRGRLEAADQGTVFLDEVGDIGLSLQPKLLRVLQARTFERLGSNTSINANIRVVSATNRNLSEMVQQGKFREDLFYRLNVVHMHIPALRERREDIPLLAQHFIQKFAELFNKRAKRFSRPALLALEEYSWPGNVRELENVVQRAVALSDKAVVDSEDLPDAIQENCVNLKASDSYEDEVRQFKRRLVLRTLQTCGWSIVESARTLGVARGYLHRLINQLEIRGKEDILLEYPVDKPGRPQLVA